MKKLYDIESIRERVSEILFDGSLTHEQQMMQLALTAENTMPYPEGTPDNFEELYDSLQICDLSEGHAPYCPRYILPDYDLLMASLDLSTTYLLLIDADAFKSINDTCGHDVGDRALRRIADAIRRHFRADDCVCRIGGDEFVVFMTHTPARQRQSIVARLRRINEELAAAGDGLPSLSVSAGIAHGGEAADKTELFEHADRALYETKRRGKGGWTFYGDGGAAASPDKEG